jgi:hypothetical protein
VTFTFTPNYVFKNIGKQEGISVPSIENNYDFVHYNETTKRKRMEGGEDLAPGFFSFCLPFFFQLVR